MYMLTLLTPSKLAEWDTIERVKLNFRRQIDLINCSWLYFCIIFEFYFSYSYFIEESVVIKQVGRRLRSTDCKRVNQVNWMKKT